MSTTTEFQYLAHAIVRMRAAKQIYSRIPTDVVARNGVEAFKKNLDLTIVDLDVQLEMGKKAFDSILNSLVKATFHAESTAFVRECLRLAHLHAWEFIGEEIPSQAARFYLYQTETKADLTGFLSQDKFRLEHASTYIRSTLIKYLWNGGPRIPATFPTRK